MSKQDERLKAAARCRECGAVYSAWIHPDTTIDIIGRKDGCRCGARAFQDISRATDDDVSASAEIAHDRDDGST
ncbi:hypothetical protein OB955_08490 [Halobacteria archaeon AArc-m2/3/4]|uniref:Uncharacterized protein n=1 Tax=Natronoglomus mannanivorans TaxID=2979990 RepID=A0AAP2YW27_9EURY|nr:hypothetical protein [Halobacteria archaeon AArc-xg1-1]MCU4972776.1 hypothetical protein [Halobacteria archaeon AArc-m2/3/4]